MGFLQDVFSGSVWGGGGHDVLGSNSFFGDAHGNSMDSDVHGNAFSNDAHGNDTGHDIHGNPMDADIHGNNTIDHSPPTAWGS